MAVSQVFTNSGSRGKVRLWEAAVELLASLGWRGTRAVCGRVGYAEATACIETIGGERPVFVVREDR